MTVQELLHHFNVRRAEDGLDLCDEVFVVGPEAKG